MSQTVPSPLRSLAIRASQGARWLVLLSGLASLAVAAETGQAPRQPALVGTAAAAPAVDPMDALREKLIAKLGAMKVPEAPTPYVVRVVSKAGESASGKAPSAQVLPPDNAAAAAADNAAATTRARLARLRAAKAEAGQQPDALSAHWRYDGADGPAQWSQLKPEFALCGKGQRQSPIDIRDGIAVDLEPIRFDYQPVAAAVIDNGHTVQVNLAKGNSIEVQGRRFELRQFHFHRPSEERINGRQFDMVVHLVHQDGDGRLAVLAVLLESGSAQPLVQSVWNDLPLERHTEMAMRGPLDLSQLLPVDRRYYTYMGSLTTPPCSEGVLWLVLRQPVAIAAAQIGVFSRLYPMNARPLQQAEGRLIKQSF